MLLKKNYKYDINVGFTSDPHSGLIPLQFKGNKLRYNYIAVAMYYLGDSEY